MRNNNIIGPRSTLRDYNNMIMTGVKMIYDMPFQPYTYKNDIFACIRELYGKLYAH